ncbi:MAG TPA: twin-arginine translocation signal domain-containing protein [Bacteroidetes bacterium]|nr:twin-arginine translocation signal domain-containing protein [Bacteroidota bacterium]
MKKTRRSFIKHAGTAAGAGLFWLYGCGGGNHAPQKETGTKPAPAAQKELFFNISLAQWSLHRALFDKKMDNLDFAATARNKYGIGAVEYVSQFFADKAEEKAYLAEMNKRAADNGVKNVLIMIDREGHLAESDDKERNQAVENHYKWIDAAHALGCHSIRVNAFSSNPDMKEAAKAAVEGLGKLAEHGQQAGINVIVENHGGYSSNGKWLSGVMKAINLPNIGTLPDFGNFCIRRDTGKEWEGKCVEEYDRYLGVKELMPFAKGVSAKSYDFDEKGNETKIDFYKMLKVVKDAGYSGHIGIEYEGSRLSEDEGIKKTKALLEKVGREI